MALRALGKAASTIPIRERCNATAISKLRELHKQQWILPYLLLKVNQMSNLWIVRRLSGFPEMLEAALFLKVSLNDLAMVASHVVSLLEPIAVLERPRSQLQNAASRAEGLIEQTEELVRDAGESLMHNKPIDTLLSIDERLKALGSVSIGEFTRRDTIEQIEGLLRLFTKARGVISLATVAANDLQEYFEPESDEPLSPAVSNEHLRNREVNTESDTCYQTDGLNLASEEQADGLSELIHGTSIWDDKISFYSKCLRELKHELGTVCPGDVEILAHEFTAEELEIKEMVSQAIKDADAKGSIRHQGSGDQSF